MFGGGSTEQQMPTVSYASSAFADRLSGTPAGDFWAAEHRWQQEECAKKFDVKIFDPQTRSATFMTTYTDYMLSSTICEEGVRRRFSDFEWLRNLLGDRYSGVAIPCMPEKRLIGAQDKAFIEERMAGLQEFTLLLLANPYVRNDATLRMFFTLKGSGEFEQAKKAASAGAGADPKQNAGLARWFGVLRALPLPGDSDQACQELTSATDEMEARVVAVLGGVNRYYEACRANAEALKAIKDAMGDWANSTRTAAAGMSDTLGALKRSTGVLADKVKECSKSWSEAGDLAAFGPNEIQIFLMDALVTELHRLKSLRKLMASREAAQAEYGKAWLKQDRLKAEEKGFNDKGRVDKAEQMQVKISEAILETKARKERLDDISKGALYIESDRCARARMARLIAMSGQYAALSIASGKKTAELWEKFLGAMRLDQNAQITDAQGTLTGASSMHGLDTVPGSNLSLPVPTTVLEGNGFSAGGAGGSSGGSSSGGSAGGAGAASPAPTPMSTFLGSSSEAASSFAPPPPQAAAAPADISSMFGAPSQQAATQEDATTVDL